jgi:hypothetical protein
MPLVSVLCHGQGKTLEIPEEDPRTYSLAYGYEDRTLQIQLGDRNAQRSVLCITVSFEQGLTPSEEVKEIRRLQVDHVKIIQELENDLFSIKQRRSLLEVTHPCVAMFSHLPEIA